MKSMNVPNVRAAVALERMCLLASKGSTNAIHTANTGTRSPRFAIGTTPSLPACPVALKLTLHTSTHYEADFPAILCLCVWRPGPTTRFGSQQHSRTKGLKRAFVSYVLHSQVLRPGPQLHSCIAQRACRARVWPSRSTSRGGMLPQRSLLRTGFHGPVRSVSKAPLTVCESVRSRPSEGRKLAEAPAAASAVCIETRSSEDAVVRGRSNGLGTASPGAQKRMVTPPPEPVPLQPVATTLAAAASSQQADSAAAPSVSQPELPAQLATTSGDQGQRSANGALRAEDAWEAFEQQLEAGKQWEVGQQ